MSYPEQHEPREVPEGSTDEADPPSSEGGEKPVVRRTESLLPAEAFSVLGNETRIAILQALLDAGGDRDAVPFTALFDRVDVDDSAKFNYHLQKLTGHFVRRTEEGYRFRPAGQNVVSAIYAGTLTDRTRIGSFDVAGECLDCTGDLHGWYADERLTIACADCRALQVSYPFPPGGLEDRSPEDLLEAFHHYVRHHYCLAADGVCPDCAGSVATALVRAPTAADAESDRETGELLVEHDCRRCGYSLRSPAGVHLLDDADVVTFHAERGVDLGDTPFWTLDWCVGDRAVTIVDDDPLCVSIAIECDGDVLSVTLDESLSTVEKKRTSDARRDSRNP